MPLAPRSIWTLPRATSLELISFSGANPNHKKACLRSGSGLGLWRCHPAPAGTQPLAKFFPFFGSALLPAAAHATPVSAPPSRTAESTEEELAQDDQSHRLPVANQFQSKEARHQPVPQAHDHQPKSGNHAKKQQREQRKLHYAKKTVISHFCSSPVSQICYSFRPTRIRPVHNIPRSPNHGALSFCSICTALPFFELNWRDF